MPRMSVSHFEACLLFAFFASIVLGVVTRKTDRDRIVFGLRCFGYFVASVFVLGWLMYLGHR